MVVTTPDSRRSPSCELGGRGLGGNVRVGGWAGIEVILSREAWLPLILGGWVSMDALN